MRNILIFTSKTDHAVNLITAWLDKLGCNFIRINTDELPNKNLGISLQHTSNYSINTVTIDGKETNLAEIQSILWRRASWPSLNFNDSNREEFVRQEWRYALWSLITTFQGYWVNHPLWGNNLLEHNKLHQLKIAVSSGLLVPDTIITNSFDKISEFCLAHGGFVACKPIHNQLFLDEQKNAYGIYTQLVTHEQLQTNKQNISVAPILVQEYVKKTVEIRVTIIGDSIFACEINSQASQKTLHDWRRYDFDNVKHSVHCLPDQVKKALMIFMKRSHLNYGAIDLILTPEEKYVFLEVNPSGQYGWIEELTGMPISETFAKSLISPKAHGFRKIAIHDFDNATRLGQ